MQINFKIMKNLLPFLFILLLACNQPNDSRLNQRIDSLCFVIKQDAYYDSLLIEEVKFDIEAHRRVIKMHGKAIKFVANRQLKADSLDGKDSKFYRTMDKIGYGASVLRKALIGI